MATLKEGQFKLVMMESTTGIVLNENMEYANCELDKHIFIFNSLLETKEFIAEKRRKNTYFEVFSHEEILVHEEGVDP